MHIEAPIIHIMKILYDYEKEHPEYQKIFEKYYIEEEEPDEEIKIIKQIKPVKPITKSKLNQKNLL
jgi:hypothetical protein